MKIVASWIYDSISEFQNRSIIMIFLEASDCTDGPDWTKHMSTVVKIKKNDTITWNLSEIYLLYCRILDNLKIISTKWQDALMDNNGLATNFSMANLCHLSKKSWAYTLYHLLSKKSYSASLKFLSHCWARELLFENLIFRDLGNVLYKSF